MLFLPLLFLASAHAHFDSNGMLLQDAPDFDGAALADGDLPLPRSTSLDDDAPPTPPINIGHFPPPIGPSLPDTDSPTTNISAKCSLALRRFVLCDLQTDIYLVCSDPTLLKNPMIQQSLNCTDVATCSTNCLHQAAELMQDEFIETSGACPAELLAMHQFLGTGMVVLSNGGPPPWGPMVSARWKAPSADNMIRAVLSQQFYTIPFCTSRHLTYVCIDVPVCWCCVCPRYVRPKHMSTSWKN